MGEATPVGFVPGGGTSVLPRALGLPRDPVAAARRIGRGDVRRISVGRVNGRRFGFNAGIGFDAEIVRRVDALGRRPDGRRPGDVAFAWTAVRTVAARRGRYDAVLEIDGLGRVAFALIANCDPYTYAGRIALHVAPLARFELGLDVVASASVRARQLPWLAARLALGKGRDRTSSTVTISTASRSTATCRCRCRSTARIWATSPKHWSSASARPSASSS